MQSEEIARQLVCLQIEYHPVLVFMNQWPRRILFYKRFLYEIEIKVVRPFCLN